MLQGIARLERVNMSKKNYTRIQILSLINMMLFLCPLRNFLYDSKILAFTFLISSVVCVIFNFVGIIDLGIIKKKIYVPLGVMVFVLSVICLYYAIGISDQYLKSAVASTNERTVVDHNQYGIEQLESMG